LITESGAADQLALAVTKGKPVVLDPEMEYMYRFRRQPFGHRRTHPTEVVPGLLIDVIMQGIRVPEGVSAKTLVQFKQTHIEELSLLREEVGRLTAELPRDASVEAMRQAVNDQYQTNVLPAMKSLKQSLGALRWEDALNGFIKVSCFSLPSASALLLAHVPGSIALMAGVGVSIVASAFHFVGEKQKICSNNPYSYLLSLERQL
jgi:hypothetical protein